MRQAIDALRDRINAELDAQLALLAERHETDLAKVRLAAEREAEARQAATASPAGSNLSDLLRQIDSATTVSDVLTAVLRCARSGGARAALFVGPGFDRWGGGGSPGHSPDVEARRDLLNSAMTAAQVVKLDDRAMAAPLALDGIPVAVLYAERDESHGGGWSDSPEVLALYASARLGYLTALRAAQAHQRLGAVPAAPPATSDPQAEDPEQSARRYARLLVSEIKLYNEAAVREGRAHRDLAQRLAGDIERARRLYEERVSSAVSGRAQYFQQELVQTLAGGDSSLLG